MATTLQTSTDRATPGVRAGHSRSTSPQPHRQGRALLVLLALTVAVAFGLLPGAVPAQATPPSSPLDVSPTDPGPLPLGYLAIAPDDAGTVCHVKTLEGCEHAALVVRAIDATPCTGRITATFYSMSIDAYADALVARERCGTELHILTWHGLDEDKHPVSDSDQLRRVHSAIKKYGHGWYKSCRYSCYDTRGEGTMHMKEWLFSSTGGQQDVIISSENNATYNADIVHFGSLTVLSDSCAYPALAAWIDLGRQDKAQTTPQPISTCDGQQTFHLAPTKDNAALDLLRAVKEPAPGCRVEHDMNQVTIDAPTDEVVRLHQAGCQTRAVVDWKLFSHGELKSASQMKQIRRLVAAGVPTYDASWKPTAYNHRKATIVENGDVRWVASGATNQTAGSFKSANILLVSRVGTDVTAAFAASDVMVAYSHELSLKSVGCVGAKKKQPAGCTSKATPAAPHAMSTADSGSSADRAGHGSSRTERSSERGED